MCSATRGFTIIELVTVILVLSILALGTTRFLTDASNGYATTMNRADLASDARSAIARVEREVREALPNSARVSAGGECLEFIPIQGGSVYLSAPVGVAGNSLQAVPLDIAPITATSRVAIRPLGNPYNLTTVSAISPVISVNAPDVNNEVRIDFAASHRFPRESPEQRFYLVDAPVSYCISSGVLWRYTGYGYTAAQPGIVALPGSTPNRVMLAQSIGGSAPYFNVSGATLNRNAVVQLNLEFADAGDAVRISQLVHLRNLP